MARTARIKLDPFLMAIIAAAVVASFLPATGIAAFLAGAVLLAWVAASLALARTLRTAG